MLLRRATVAVAAALALGAVTAGCGGDDLDAVARRGVVRVDLREYRIDPQDWRVTAGEIRLVARNDGRLAHNLVVESVTHAQDEQPRVYAHTGTAPPGRTVSTTARLRPGTYRLACTLGHHDDLGMYGRLEVVARG
jgi:plastocyanin